MLILKRKIGETILIGDNVTVTVLEIERGRVSLAIGAPVEIRILRSELNGVPPRRRADHLIREYTVTAEQLAVGSGEDVTP